MRPNMVRIFPWLSRPTRHRYWMAQVINFECTTSQILDGTVGMKGPSKTDWSFEEICASDSDRAARLEAAALPDILVATLAVALQNAIYHGEVRYGLDSLENKFIECRAIIQFKVDPNLYDWFFNARTGYRAQFLTSPDASAAFNTKIIEVLRNVLDRHLPQNVVVRRIRTVRSKTGPCEESREDYDIGAKTLPRGSIVRSLDPSVSKIWIGERLMENKCGQLPDIGFATLREAAQGPKLRVPVWEDAVNPLTCGDPGEGLRAPYPLPECAWLDLKGGFVRSDGSVKQLKDPKKRAAGLNQCGWT